MSQQITQQQAQDAFNGEVEKQLTTWQNDTMFDKTLLPEKFAELVKDVLTYNSPFNLRMAVDYYKQLVQNTSNVYTLMEVSCICHAAKLRNAYEMGMDMTEYIEFQEGIEVIAQEYLKITAEKKKSIERKILATINAEKGVPEQKKTIDFPVPTAMA